MKLPLARLCLVVTLAGLMFPAALPADDTPAAGKKFVPGKFMRLRRDAREQPVALETATVRYVPAAGEEGLVVDLIGVVHIGEKAYYEKLNKQFEQYDALLYELVAPQGTRIPKGGKRETDNPLALIQQLAKSVLNLDSQVEHIDYTKKNFVHADLSPEEMGEAMRKRGDNAFTVMLSVFADLMRQQNLQAEKAKEKARADRDEEEVDLLSLFLDPDGGLKMKRMLAEQFDALDSPDGGLGPTLSTILVADRNAAAVKVLQKEMAKGKKKIGIFYGAAHMPDFEKRLQEEFGLKRQSEQWLIAWDLKKKSRSIGLGDLLKRFGQ